MADRKVSDYDLQTAAQADVSADYVMVVHPAAASAADRNKRMVLTEVAKVSARKALGIIIDGGGSAITTGVKGDLVIPWTGTIKQWTVLGDQSGSIQIDVWKTSYASAPPTVANTIAGSQKPTLSSVSKNQNTNPSTWTVAVTAGDVLRFNVDSVSGVTRVTCVIEMDL